MNIQSDGSEAADAGQETVQHVGPKASWWRCCHEATWVMFVTLAAEWAIATMTCGTPVPFGSFNDHSVQGGLVGGLFCLLIASPGLIVIVLIIGTTVWGNYPWPREMAYRKARLAAFILAIPIVPVFLLLLPVDY